MGVSEGMPPADIDSITAVGRDGTLFPIDKMRAHVENVPHLAISVFVFRSDELLLQQRAMGKYHSGGLWANTCCSHPRWRESLRVCAERRLREETGLDMRLGAFGRIDYAAPVGDGLFENEHVQCFVGQATARNLVRLEPDPHEVAATRWMTLDALVEDIALKPMRYTPWLRIYVERHLALLQRAARAAAKFSAI